MKEVHLTNASIPGVRCLREMKASTIKRRRDTTYTSKMTIKNANKLDINRIKDKLYILSKTLMREKSRGNRKAMIPVITAEQTRHSIPSSLEGKVKNHPAQCIPPNTTPTADIIEIYASSLSSRLIE